jgi:hypothetical protein
MNSIFKYYPKLKDYIPHDKEFLTARFKKTFHDTYTLSYSKESNLRDYEDFKNLIYSNTGKKFYPILRMSDGEMLLLTGLPPESRRASYIKRLIVMIKIFVKRILYKDLILSSHIFGSFDHGTGTSETYKFKSGRHSKKQTSSIRTKFINEIDYIAKNGVLAIHYSYSSNHALVERYWPKFTKILFENSIKLNSNNCFPFYFVYMFLSEKDSFKKAVENKKVLCVSSASGEKRNAIVKSISSFGPSKVDWLSIPTSQTFFYEFEDRKLDSYDIIFLAAGTGKTNIVKQLSKYNCPVIDCGYYFEVWNNEKLKFNRIGCATDDEY